MLQRIRLEQVQSNSTNNYYATFAEQLSGMMLPTVDVQNGLVGKQVYNLKSGMTYAVGTNQLKVSLNGIEMFISDGDYTELNESSVQMNFPIHQGDIFVFRIEGAGGGSATSDHAHYENIIPNGVPNGILKTFTLPAIPRKKADLIVCIDGIFQKQSSYSLVVNQLTFNQAPLAGMVISTSFIV